MPRYRVYRLKDAQREHFRWSAHTGGLAIVKQKDYEASGEVESVTPYSLWKELQGSESPHTERPLSPGDVLETVEPEGSGKLLIAKYIGFEPAQWFVPEMKTVSPATEDALAPQAEKALQN